MLTSEMLSILSVFYSNPTKFRHQNMIRSILIISLTILLIGCSGREDQPREAEEPSRVLDYVSEVTFERADGDSVSTVRVAVADDDHTRSEGLMNVSDLPDDAGMLFIFETNEPRSFWMASTPLSLDIIFINEDYEIVRIHRNTPPYSHDRIESEEPAKYVVEVNAGYTLRRDITEGMRIRISDKSP